MTGAENLDPVQAPAFQIVSGQVSDEEVAALTAVFAVLRRGRGRPHAPASSAIAGGWRSHWHLVRQPMLQGHAAWRSTARR
ncbi:MAG: acyl-CoA carboxylase subunit epsilon [Propioniciclava sp.]|uniref:acyl-CoA carboxylase subunit epsilon n=1 Tax=Propioniciclava sp. TaxID=2038686 RepID=UPI0039E2B000